MARPLSHRGSIEARHNGAAFLANTKEGRNYNECPEFAATALARVLCATEILVVGRGAALRPRFTFF
jgi:hypothetical protein